MQETFLSVIVAALNEQAVIERCVRRLFAVYPEGCEVLVVDGGTDQTCQVVEGLCADFPRLRYVRNDNDRGKGHATRTGIASARADIMAEIDADLQFRPEEIPKLIEPLQTGQADVVLGSRFTRGSVRRAGSETFLRHFGNRVTSLYASLLYWHRMTDVLAGMSAWTRRVVETIQLKSDNYSYAVELPVKALRKGLRVVDVPVTFEPRKGGHSRVNVVCDGLALLRDTTRFRLGLR